MIRPVLGAFIMTSGLASAEPGGEMNLEHRETAAQLYLAAVHRDDAGKIAGFDMAWLPGDLVDRCENRDLAYCLELDGCLRFGNDGGSCSAVKLDPANAGRRSPAAVPTKLLRSFISANEATGREVARRLAADMGKPGVEKRTLTKASAIRVTVRWELWSNGEGFSILKTRTP